MGYIGQPQALRRMNLAYIDSLLREQGSMTKPELSRITGLSLVTVNKAVDALVASGNAIPAGIRDSAGGRNAKAYEANPRQYAFLVILYHQGYCHCMLANALGQGFAQAVFPVEATQIQAELYRCVDAMRKRLQGIPLRSIGLGLPGVVQAGVVTSIPALPALHGIAISDVLASRYGCEVIVENDINLAAYGLYQQRFSSDMDHFMLLYLEQNIGAGLVLNGQLHRGASAFAGEVGGMALCTPAENTSENPLETEFACIRNAIQSTDDPTLRDLLTSQAQQLAGQCIQNIICVVNPSLIALVCDLFTAANVEQMMQSLPLPTNHRPTLLLLEDITKDCLQGMIHLCLQSGTTNHFHPDREVM